MKSNNYTKKFIAILLSVVMITGLIPYQVFSDTTEITSEINTSDDVEADNTEETIDAIVNSELSNDVETDIDREIADDDLKDGLISDEVIGYKNSNSERTFDIQEIDYWRSCQKFGIKYQSKWEGVAPYAPLFGQYVKNGKETRPLGDSEWGNNDWITGYLMVDVPSFGENGTEGLPRDEYGLSTIGIVRVDNKYSRTDDFSTWNESIAEAFKEYNGNAGFGEWGDNSDVDQSTKLIIWDGYRRIPGFNWLTRKEYVKSVADAHTDTTIDRQNFSNYVKEHLENGAKLQGFITVADGLRHLYEPTGRTYRWGREQIIDIPQIKITALTYDVDLVHKNAPEGIELPERLTIRAGDFIELPSLEDYEYVAYDKDGKSFDLEKPVVSNIELTIIWNKKGELIDSDDDGAFDKLEDIFGTDKSKIDTDGDGISDLTEIMYSRVFNPLKEDTDGNGISDGDEDTDEDGLINRLEEEYKSDLLARDSDYDGLLDGDEVGIYKTNPSKKDTDNDGVNDKEEIEFKTNPLVYNELFDIDYAYQDENDSVEVNLKINLPAETAKTLTIQKIDNKILFPDSMPGYLGSAYDFYVDGTIDEAIISFKFDTNSVDADAEPVIYYYNEAENTLEALETTVNDGVASARVNHFSTYILLDRKIYEGSFIWEDNWQSNFKYNDVELVLVIDDSGSMTENDRSYRRLDVAKNLIDKLPGNSKIGIVKFEDNHTVLTPSMISDRAQAKKYLSNAYFYSSGGTSMYTAINAAFPLFKSNDNKTLKMMVVLSDGATDDTGMHSSTVTKANSYNVKIYTVGLGNSTSYFNSYLKPLADNTGGSFYLSSNSSELYKIYKDIIKKIDITTDSDKDGIPDYYEENLPLFNGMRIKLDKNNPDTDNDGIEDGKEVVKLKYEYNSDKTKVKVTGIILTNPTNIDSDFDGISDEEEYDLGTNPNKADTDGDKLLDGFEVALGYDPLDSDADGDGRSDYQEYKEKTDPYSFNKNWMDHLSEFSHGFLAGDFIQDTDSLAVTAGQITSSCIPLVDVRDVIANLWNGDYLFAGISGLGLVPAAGDLAKAAGKSAKFILKNIDDLPKIVGMLEYLTKNFPGIAKYLGKTDEFVEAAKRISKADAVNLTREQHSLLINTFREAGIHVAKTSNTLKIRRTIKLGDIWNLPALIRGDKIDEALNYHSSIDGLPRNFPVVDRLEGKTIVSTKSIDITSKSYQKPSRLRAKIKRDLDSLVNFEKRFDSDGKFIWNGKPFKKNLFNKKALEIVLPDVVINEKTLKVLNELKSEYKNIDIWFVIAN